MALLDRVLKARYLTVTIALMILIVTLGYLRSGRLGFEMFPYVESDTAACAFEFLWIPCCLDAGNRSRPYRFRKTSGCPDRSRYRSCGGARGIKSTIGGDIWGGGTGGAHAGALNLSYFLPANVLYLPRSFLTARAERYY